MVPPAARAAGARGFWGWGGDTQASSGNGGSYAKAKSGGNSCGAGRLVVGRSGTLSDVRGLPVATDSWDAVERLDVATWDYAR